MYWDHILSNERNPATHQPFVSIITPFYNTEQYIAECIESVLAQTYSNWEYILVNNQSTDRSRSIAERYAQEDKRIRLLDTPKHLEQVENFNAALGYISDQSRYCKMVLADDWLFPECVEQMVTLAEANASVAIVSSYRLFGDEITGDGLSYGSSVISGRKACQYMLRDGHYLTGSQSSVLLRADIVRKTHPFYPQGWLHSDTEACLRELAHHDLGFIHQVLTFSRKDNESITSEISRLGSGPIRRYIYALKYGAQFFTEAEYQAYLKRETDFYGQFLAESVFQFKPKAFWDFHRRGMRSVGADFWSLGLPKYLFLEVLDIIFNPKKTLGRVLRLMRNSQPADSRTSAPSSGKKQSANL
jgi:glycosyltransferase involved in cell wall biosynthesis